MTRTSTVQTMEATLSPMLKPARVFCLDPLVAMAPEARMMAGMVQARLIMEVQRNSTTKESMRAPMAKCFRSSLGVDTVVVVAVG